MEATFVKKEMYMDKLVKFEWTAEMLEKEITVAAEVLNKFSRGEGITYDEILKSNLSELHYPTFMTQNQSEHYLKRLRSIGKGECERKVINTSTGFIEIEVNLREDVAEIVESSLGDLFSSVKDTVEFNMAHKSFGKGDITFEESNEKAAELYKYYLLKKEDINTVMQNASFTGLRHDKKVQFNRKEVKAIKENYKLDFVIPGLPVGKVGVLAGQGGIGKSFFGLELAHMVILKRKYFTDDESWNTTENVGRVLYVTMEDGAEAINIRRDHIIDKLEIESRINEKEGDILYENLLIEDLSRDSIDIINVNDLQKSNHWNYLDAKVKTHKPRLVIVDTLSRIHCLSENDNTAMARIIQLLSMLAAKHNAAIIILHHENKGGDNENSQNSIRGGSAIVANSRWTGRLRRITQKEAKDNNISEDEEFRDGMLNFSVVKCNETKPSQIWLLRGENGVLEYDEELTHLLSPRRTGIGYSISDYKRAIAEAKAKKEDMKNCYDGENGDKRSYKKDKKFFENEFVKIMEDDFNNRG